MSELYRNDRQIERILDLAQRLEGRRRWRVKELADYYGVYRSTIYDDLQILGRFCCVCNEDKRWWIEPGRNPIPMSFTSEEAQALSIIVTASPMNVGAPFEKHLKSAIKKLKNPLAALIEDAMQRADKMSIKIKSGNNYESVEQCFSALEQAIEEQRTVIALYQAGGKPEPLEHKLDPYAIFFRKEDWYLAAYTHIAKAIGTFKIIRFKTVQLTHETFDYLSNFDLDEYLSSMWELFSGPPIDITVKIDSHKAYLVEEKQRHPTQEIVERLEDGSVIIKVHVPKEEFSWWVLSLGTAAEILEPQELREQFRKIAEEMLKMYSEKIF